MLVSDSAQKQSVIKVRNITNYQQSRSLKDHQLDAVSLLIDRLSKFTYSGFYDIRAYAEDKLEEYFAKVRLDTEDLPNFGQNRLKAEEEGESVRGASPPSKICAKQPAKPIAQVDSGPVQTARQEQ